MEWSDGVGRRRLWRDTVITQNEPATARGGGAQQTAAKERLPSEDRGCRVLDGMFQGTLHALRTQQALRQRYGRCIDTTELRGSRCFEGQPLIKRAG